ncbi:MAG: lipoate--protein ligase, partial [Bacillota bacterium]|nr:lipoate--protein ligase [Bacillota bacterium]
MQNDTKLELVISNSFDPYFNLALEEELFNHIEENKIILYLWQNQNTIVIGRNQNAYKECDYNLLKRDGGKLARRLSGGGAVYHDLGNLNFTFISKTGLFDIHKQLEVIIKALEKFHIKAEFSGRNDILAKGLKFSGNAYYYDEDKCCHHGTILLSADLSKLTKYLTVSEDKLKWKGIDSVRSRVINLMEINPNVNVNNVKEALAESFSKVYQREIC